MTTTYEARHEVVLDDTRALYVMDGELIVTLDGESDGGEWEGKLGSGYWEMDGDVTVMQDDDGNELARLANDEDWDKWLAGGR
jgi:hypothetical protein